MKTRILKTAILIGLTLCIASCSKVSSVEPTTKELLTKNVWKLTAITPADVHLHDDWIGNEWTFSQDTTLTIFIQAPIGPGTMHASWNTTSNGNLVIKMPTMQPDGSLALVNVLDVEISSLNTSYLELREYGGGMGGGFSVHYYKFLPK